MDRNVESHFATLPDVDIERSIVDIPFDHLTSFNVGDLIPFYWSPVLPGSTFNITTSVVARMQTLLTPIFSNLYLDTYYFYVPYRICWNHWKEFMGENTESAWVPQTEYTIPRLKSPSTGFDSGTIADYFGVPVGVPFDGVVDDLTLNALPFRALALIADQWFRDQNLSDPLNIPLGDANQNGSNGDNYITDVVNGGKPFKVAKFHDYFTSCLPSPLKALQPVSINIAAQSSGLAPVVTGTNRSSVPSNSEPLIFRMIGSPGSGGASNGKLLGTVFNSNGNYTAHLMNTSASLNDNVNPNGIVPSNLYADVSSIAFDPITINDLRLAFQLQKFYERCARSGTRYRETLKAHFGVTSPDSRMMIPEYLGGHRIPIQIHQVANTGQTETAYLGDLGALSNTVDIHEDFEKSFVEHGIVIGVCCVRYDKSYPQGLPREFAREKMLDFYWPVFANIGEQPVRTYEIDATHRSSEDRKSVFGYQEAWADYRYGVPSRVSGEMRPGISNTLSSWHLADYYTSTPRLSDSWIREDENIVDRVLAVGHTVSNQIFADFYVKNHATLPMPMYSIPGLIDHH